MAWIRTCLHLPLLLLLLGIAAQSDAALVTTVQRGNTNMGTATAATVFGATVYRVTVTLGTPIDASKSYVDASFRTTSNDPASRVTAELSNTTLVLTTFATANRNQIDVDWEVVTFSDASVQRGVTQLTTTTATIPITAVPRNKCMLLMTERTADTNQARDENWTVRGTLTGTAPNYSNLVLQRDANATNVTVVWQVVEFQDLTTTTYHGTATMASGTTVMTAPIGGTIDLSRSFLFSNRSARSNTKGKEQNYMIGASFGSTTQMRFEREAGDGDVDISFFAIELGPGSAVDSGTITMPANGTGLTYDATIAAVAPSKTITIVSVYGGGSDVNNLASDSITSQLVNATTLRFQRRDTRSVVRGVYFVIQFEYLSAYRETYDGRVTTPNGKIDAIRFVAYEPVNDNFTGMTVTVAGYTLQTPAWSTGATANDSEFFLLLNEGATWDTGAQPMVRIVNNTTLSGTTSLKLVRTESIGYAPADGARPVLVQAEWLDIGSYPGVGWDDTILLTFSENVSTSSALISDIGLPVIGDSLDTSIIADQGPAQTVTVTLRGSPALTPGGTYNSAFLSPGSPTGVYIANGARIVETSVPTRTALNQLVAQAVDLLPGGSVLSIAWSDDGSGVEVTKDWNLGLMWFGESYAFSATQAPAVLSVRNAGNVRINLSVSCSNAAPAGWTLAALAGTDSFEMKTDSSFPLDGIYELDLSTGAKTLGSGIYSGREKPFDLLLTTPTDISSGAGTLQNINITLTATQN